MESAGVAIKTMSAATGAESAVSEALLARVLAPYKPHCRYLQNASIAGSQEARSGLLRADGDFAIGESCYIADTGHFNAVEFNICYNQLAYTLLAGSVERKLIPELASWSLVDYERRQLSDFVIVDFASEFRSPMRATSFRGSVSIDKIATRRGSIFMKTRSQFQDTWGGRSRGHALIAIVNGAQP